jgi:hypothetical protein
MDKENIKHALLDHCEVFQVDLDDPEENPYNDLVKVIIETRKQILHVVKMLDR